MPLLRLDKIVTDTGACSRSRAKELIRAGGVTVNGAAACDPAAKYDPAAVSIAVNGETIGEPGHLYVMLHKPAGLLSASRDERAPTVLDLMPTEWRRRGLFCVGRLDKDTTGLLLLTDDGTFAHRVISPRGHISKLYRAAIDGTAGEEDVRAFAAGLTLRDGLHCLPARLVPVAPGEVLVEVYEGKYHQVRRMLAARSLPVTALRRERIGALPLDESLAPGAFRLLRAEELEQIGPGLMSK